TNQTLRGGSFSLSQPSVFLPGAVAELRFPGADIVRNRSFISLAGAGARLADLSGADGLRNFSHNMRDGTFELEDAHFITGGDFTNDGTIKLARSSFIVSGSLTNFDPATRTLTGGVYDLFAQSEEGGFIFPGAAIENNAASLILGGEGTFRDEAGQDALRHLKKNLAGGVLEIGANTHFPTAGEFTNAGAVRIPGRPMFAIPELQAGSFTVAAGSQYLQTGGTTTNLGDMTADTFVIDGGILEGASPPAPFAGEFHGDVVIGNGALDGGVIRGNLTLSSGSTFGPLRVTVTGTAQLAGTLRIGQMDLFPGSGDTFTILSAGESLTGSFANAPPGSRLTTIGGRGSYVVNYVGKEVVLSSFEHATPASQLLNISSRSFVGVDDRVMICGFIITGAQPKRLIIRGIGPSEGPSGVWMQNPTLQLHSATSLLATNDDWRATQQAEIEATQLAPMHDREAAIVATLPPGAYTAICKARRDLPGARSWKHMISRRRQDASGISAPVRR
ncbi:MAG TPA: hypothetical protein VG095_00055, partial [Chthoniobacterales bacterium]|nr:hypothetical protein [Chthoniobacterales bacterium]